MKRKKKKRNQEKWNNDLIREYVALSLIRGLGAQRIRRLLQVVDHPRDIFRIHRKKLQTIRGIGPALGRTIASFNQWDEVDRVLKESEKLGFAILTFHDENYPGLLREIYDPPLLLWMKGDPAVLNTDGIAVIGTRQASKYGKKMASRFAADLVHKGLTVVSGLAYGIDAEAHRATVGAGGKTIAVLGSGLDIIYPDRHKRLAAQIVESGGAVLSEFPPGTAPDAGNFPVRNRVVSGLSLGTLVIESGMEGGSMITAKLALDQNREVFVVPHSLDSGTGTGCNSLIQRGMGKLVDNVDSILEELRFRFPQKREHAVAEEVQAAWRQLDLDELSVNICRLLENGPEHLDMIGNKLNVSSHVLLSRLLELEMQGCVRQNAGKIFELA